EVGYIGDVFVRYFHVQSGGLGGPPQHRIISLQPAQTLFRNDSPLPDTAGQSSGYNFLERWRNWFHKAFDSSILLARTAGARRNNNGAEPEPAPSHLLF